MKPLAFIGIEFILEESYEVLFEESNFQQLSRLWHSKETENVKDRDNSFGFYDGRTAACDRSESTAQTDRQKPDPSFP